jgi:hypothetical protein
MNGAEDLVAHAAELRRQVANLERRVDRAYVQELCLRGAIVGAQRSVRESSARVSVLEAMLEMSSTSFEGER